MNPFHILKAHLHLSARVDGNSEMESRRPRSLALGFCALFALLASMSAGWAQETASASRTAEGARNSERPASQSPGASLSLQELGFDIKSVATAAQMKGTAQLQERLDLYKKNQPWRESFLATNTPSKN